MKLLTKELERKLPSLYSQEHVKDPIVWVKFFHPLSHWRWYATEYSPKEKLFFGWVAGDFPELGYFSLRELESVKVRGLGMERDMYFTPMPLSEVKRRHAKYGAANPKAHTEVKMARIPKCDFCARPSRYDGRTQMGPWAYMCQQHYNQYGVGLGLGYGQKLVMPNPVIESRVKFACNYPGCINRATHYVTAYDRKHYLCLKHYDKVLLGNPGILSTSTKTPRHVRVGNLSLLWELGAFNSENLLAIDWYRYGTEWKDFPMRTPVGQIYLQKGKYMAWAAPSNKYFSFPSREHAIRYVERAIEQAYYSGHLQYYLRTYKKNPDIPPIYATPANIEKWAQPGLVMFSPRTREMVVPDITDIVGAPRRKKFLDRTGLPMILALKHRKRELIALNPKIASDKHWDRFDMYGGPAGATTLNFIGTALSRKAATKQVRGLIKQGTIGRAAIYPAHRGDPMPKRIRINPFPERQAMMKVRQQLLKEGAEVTMANPPRTVAGWARKLYRMKGNKFAARVIGWKTPRTKPDRPFGMIIPMSPITSFRQVPKSAYEVSLVMVQKDGRPSPLIRISRERLVKEFYIDYAPY